MLWELMLYTVSFVLPLVIAGLAGWGLASLIRILFKSESRLNWILLGLIWIASAGIALELLGVLLTIEVVTYTVIAALCFAVAAIMQERREPFGLIEASVDEPFDQSMAPLPRLAGVDPDWRDSAQKLGSTLDIRA